MDERQFHGVRGQYCFSASRARPTNEEYEHGDLRCASPHDTIPLSHGSGAIPAVGFGTLIPDPIATRQATETALEVGFRHLDCAERYRNEEAVGDAMRAVFQAGTVRREDIFVTTKLWNSNHRPERVKAEAAEGGGETRQP